jgi:transposase
MRRAQISDADIMRIAVQQEILRSEDSRYDHRLHGILLSCSGKSSYEIAELFGQSPRTVQYWIRRFEQKGFAGLSEEERPGRPSAIDKAVRRGIEKDLRTLPRDLGYMQNLWDGNLLSFHLEKQYDVTLGERQCRRLFRQLGFRRRKPRPLIAKADPEEQIRYNKTQDSGSSS